MKMTKLNSLIKVVLVATGIAALAADATAGDGMPICPEYTKHWEYDLADWMETIPGTNQLGSITLPSSHDACMDEHVMSHGRSTWSTQFYRLKTQMEYGARYFDVRIEKDHTVGHARKFRAYHGDGCLAVYAYYLEEILDDAVAFVTAHTNETVILKFSHWDNDGDVWDAMGQIYDKNRSWTNYFHRASSGATEAPPCLNEVPLSDLRGKIVFLLDFHKDATDDEPTDARDSTIAKNGYRPDNGVWRFADLRFGSSGYYGYYRVYDRFSDTDSMEKLKKSQKIIWQYFDSAYEASSNAFMLCWQLTYGGNPRSNYKRAKEINPKLDLYMQNGTATGLSRPRLVNIDYVDEHVCVPIINLNAEFTEGLDLSVTYLEPRFDESGAVSGYETRRCDKMSYVDVLISDELTMGTAFYVFRSGSLMLNKGVKVDGDAKIILCNGANVTAEKSAILKSDPGAPGIEVPEGSSLTIYAQTTESDDVGSLSASGVGDGSPGIGNQGMDTRYSFKGTSAGTVVINGGKIFAKGDDNAAGIGGGYGNVNGAITINGGEVEVMGGAGAAGIGSGDLKYCYSTPDPGPIAINGGKVNTMGGGAGAGIGGGHGGTASGITINGGTVMAMCGNKNAVGIGNGYEASTAASNIFAADDVIVKAGDWWNPTTVVPHDSSTDLASLAAFNKRWVTTEPGPTEVTVVDVAGAAAKVYTNEVEITERPALVTYYTPFNVVYTAEEGYMFPGGYETLAINMTADAPEMAVELADDQQPVEAEVCTNCLVFAASKPFGIRMRSQGTQTGTFQLECSADQTYWSTFDWKNGAAAGAENRFYLRGTGNQALAKDGGKYFAFTNTADSVATEVVCWGNVMTLLDYQAVGRGDEPPMGEFAFCGLFEGFAALTDAPALPATNLANSCYLNMFKDCTALQVNTNAPGKAWSIPADAGAAAETAADWNKDMFKGTAGDITNTAVEVGVTYHVASAPVSVVVPEVEGATAQLFAFDVNGGWKAVATNVVPRKAMVRVVWTADEGKGLTADKAQGAYQWQAEFGPVVGGEIAPAPTVGEAGASEVTVDIDTRAKKSYFDAADILPVWYAADAEVKVQGQGQQSWETLVKSSATNDTVRWTPAAPDTYTLSHTAFENATIIYALPVEVTTNDLEVAGTTAQVTDDGGQPLVAQTEGELAGKLIVPSNSTVTVTWTVEMMNTYFADGSTQYTQTFTADKSVNAVSEVVTKPEEPKEPSVKLGVVAQRYPWDGKLDVQYWAKNTPNSGYLLKVTLTLPDGTSATETHAALGGKNTTTFDMKKAFGEVTAMSGVKVTAKIVIAPPQ